MIEVENRHRSSDRVWIIVEPFLGNRQKQYGRKQRDNREIFDAILWVLRTGSPWRDIPRELACWQTVYKRFVQWSESDALKKVFEAVRFEPDMQDISIDGTYIKAHRSSAGARKDDVDNDSHQHIGVSRGGRSTKIVVSVDGLGNPLSFVLAAGQVHDATVATRVLDQVDISGSTILADKAFTAYSFREYIADRDADFCIPPKSNESDPWFCDFIHYKERHVVECFFAKIKDFRRIAMRYDKLARRFAAALYLVFSLVWLA